jgi:TatD DNase family protein
MEEENKLVDVHTHLEQYTSKELAAVLKNARDTGVGCIITSGMDPETSARAVEIAKTHEQVFASVGIHPWMAADIQASNPGLDPYERLRALARHKEVIALGEIGLDFIDNAFSGVTYHDNKKLQLSQQAAFGKLVELACETGLPMIIHARGAYPAVITILKENKAKMAGGVIHNFEGDEKQTRQLLDTGFYLSFGGAVTYPDAHTLHETLRKIPLTGIVTETDSPYMPIYQQSTAKNEPSNINRIVEVIAGLKGVERERLIETVHSNIKALFTFPDEERAL